MNTISFYSQKACQKTAEQASLRYLTDASPGIFRRKCGKGFAYYFSNGEHIKDSEIINRIKQLAIPPAYEEVWICPYANGHIQATGRDIKGRKQYLYHPLWRRARKKQKFNLMQEFGLCLPAIRQFVRKELNKSLKMNKLQIISAIIYLLDNFSIRIGNTIYYKQNQSIGLTTLRKKHLSIEENQVIMDFKGKNAQMWHVLLKNKKIIRLLKKCNELPGYELFKYQDEEDRLHIISSQDVNAFLYDFTHKPFTAKDFRTWSACREFLDHLTKMALKEKLTEKQFTIVLNKVAKMLGHTPAVCKKNYLHPMFYASLKNDQFNIWVKKHYKKIAGLKKDDLLIFWLRSMVNSSH